MIDKERKNNLRLFLRRFSRTLSVHRRMQVCMRIPSSIMFERKNKSSLIVRRSKRIIWWFFGKLWQFSQKSRQTWKMRQSKSMISHGRWCFLIGALQHAATHCTTLHHTVHTTTHYNMWWHMAVHCNTLEHTAGHCNTLQHTAPRCNTLQHTATHTISSCLLTSTYKLFTYIVVCCNLLQCVVLCCNALQGVAECCRVLQGVH